jgi:SAM-dependent methyltransferase
MNYADCYDYPQYWDLAFRSETKREANFIEAACQKYCDFPVHRLFEPGCGGGRLVVEMAARGYDVVGLDLNARVVRYLEKRLARRGLQATLLQADMADFQLAPPVDAAFNTLNTFRHLTSERAARTHLESVTRSLRPGGIYILGFNLMPPDLNDPGGERWQARHASTGVSVSVRLLDLDRRRRRELLRFSLRVRNRTRELKLRSDYPLRIYTAAQFRRLLEALPALELCDVYDFGYEIDRPLELSDELCDAVFILRKRGWRARPR